MEDPNPFEDGAQARDLEGSHLQEESDVDSVSSVEISKNSVIIRNRRFSKGKGKSKSPTDVPTKPKAPSKPADPSKRRQGKAIVWLPKHQMSSCLIL
jgi:hypothetical protein